MALAKSNVDSITVTRRVAMHETLVLTLLFRAAPRLKTVIAPTIEDAVLIGLLGTEVAMLIVTFTPDVAALKRLYRWWSSANQTYDDQVPQDLEVWLKDCDSDFLTRYCEGSDSVTLETLRRTMDGITNHT